jgi:hypothetical protein
MFRYFGTSIIPTSQQPTQADLSLLFAGAASMHLIIGGKLGWVGFWGRACQFPGPQVQ